MKVNISPGQFSEVRKGVISVDYLKVNDAGEDSVSPAALQNVMYYTWLFRKMHNLGQAKPNSKWNSKNR